MWLEQNMLSKLINLIFFGGCKFYVGRASLLCYYGSALIKNIVCENISGSKIGGRWFCVDRASLQTYKGEGHHTEGSTEWGCLTAGICFFLFIFFKKYFVYFPLFFYYGSIA